jgi:exosome complex RNA-binding protein Csl4
MRSIFARRYSTALVLASVAALSSACSTGLGSLGDILGGSGTPGGQQQGQLNVEVRSVDESQRLIQVTTTQGQTGNVRYDQNTVVVYQQQQYPVTALERGDVVVMQVQEDARGELYVSRIDVQQSVQERTGQTGGNVQELSGRVANLDRNRGWFVLQTQSGNLTVSLPYNPPQATLDYFNRLRNGDTVRLEVTPLGAGRAEIYRFL